MKHAKCASLAQEIGFSAPNSCTLPWLVKGATRLCTSKKECNKLDLIAAQYFWLVNQNDYSRWFAISSPYVYTVLVTVLLVGLPKEKTAKLRDLILYSRVTNWAPVWRCSTDWNGRIRFSTWSSKQSSPPRFTCWLLRTSREGRAGQGPWAESLVTRTCCEFKVDYEKESATYHVWFREKRFKWKILDWNGRIGL